MRIAGLSCTSRRLPLHDTWDGGVSHHDIVLVRLTTDTGAEGTGVSWTDRKSVV